MAATEGRARGSRAGVEMLGEQGEGDRDDSTPAEILQEAAKRMSLTAPLVDRGKETRDGPTAAAPPAGRRVANRVLQDGIL